MAKLLANIKRNGQVENIIVRELPLGLFEVANGNHRLDAFLGAGLTNALAYNLGKVKVEVAQRVAVETNETRFETDRAKLAALLDGMFGTFPIPDLAETMPFSASELESMRQLAVFDMASFTGRHDDQSFSDLHAASRVFTPMTLRLPAAAYEVWTRWLGHCNATYDLKTPEDCLLKAITLASEKEMT